MENHGYTFKDSEKAFDDAIKVGRLSDKPEASNFAGGYMYMHTDANGRDVFKNINTRSYDV